MKHLFRHTIIYMTKCIILYLLKLVECLSDTFSVINYVYLVTSFGLQENSF